MKPHFGRQIRFARDAQIKASLNQLNLLRLGVFRKISSSLKIINPKF